MAEPLAEYSEGCGNVTCSKLPKFYRLLGGNVLNLNFGNVAVPVCWNFLDREAEESHVVWLDGMLDELIRDSIDATTVDALQRTPRAIDDVPIGIPEADDALNAGDRALAGVHDPTIEKKGAAIRSHCHLQAAQLELPIDWLRRMLGGRCLGRTL